MIRVLAVSLSALTWVGCAAARAQMPSLQPLTFEAPPAQKALEEDFFHRDRSAVGEAELKQILAAPVFLEAAARVGVLPVASGYQADEALPLEAAPATLADALETSGLFELASEVSTEWPADRGLAGLRELAARYRTEYLLLYRHRFSDAARWNAGAVGYLTLAGLLFIPGTTVETAGVLEATLYEVKSGTILFTVMERVRGSASTSEAARGEQLEALRQQLVRDGARRLAEGVLQRCRRLEAARPAKEAPGAVSAAPQG